MQSENGESNFTLQDNGDLVITCKGQVIWRSFRGQLSLEFPINRIEGLYFSPGGNVMLYKEDKSLAWQTKTNYTYATELKIENNSNLILYSQSGSIVWQSDTRCKHSTNQSGFSDFDDVNYEKEVQDIYLMPEGITESQDSGIRSTIN